MPPPAAPPADASRGPGARATGSNEGPRGTATQPFISVYDQDDDEPWDTPGPPRSADAAGVGPVPTGGGSAPPEFYRSHRARGLPFDPASPLASEGKGSGKSGDGGHRRGGLPGTGSGIRERCTCRVLCFVASWSDARLMHLELARSDCFASRLCLRGFFCWGGCPPGALSRLAGVF